MALTVLLFLTAIFGLASPTSALELKGANGRVLNVAGVKEARLDGLILRVTPEAEDIAVAWDKFDLAALKAEQPEIEAAYEKVKSGEAASVPLRLGLFAPQPYSLDLTQVTSRVTAHDLDLSGASGITAQLKPYRFTDDDGWTMVFRFYAPESKPAGAPLPLVIYLHGAGSGGDDNVRQVPNVNRGLLFLKDENREKYPCFVLVPQCPAKQVWSLGPLNREPDAGDHVTSLVKELAAKVPDIDEHRLYVTGYSLGGFASLRLAMEYPDVYAATVPMAGSASKDEFRGIHHIAPTWFFYNEDDTAYVKWHHQAHEEIEKLGNEHRVTVYPTGGHGGTAKAYDEPELLPWLFSHRKG